MVGVGGWYDSLFCPLSPGWCLDTNPLEDSEGGCYRVKLREELACPSCLRAAESEPVLKAASPPYIKADALGSEIFPIHICIQFPGQGGGARLSDTHTCIHIWIILEYFGSRTRPHLIQIQWGTEVVGQVERIRQLWPCNYLWTAASY